MVKKSEWTMIMNELAAQCISSAHVEKKKRRRRIYAVRKQTEFKCCKDEMNV